jgi:predicted ribosome quality control (RQC) complex YloA/Tae2 family protein
VFVGRTFKSAWRGDQETLLDAATLAVHHSPAREEAQADVTYAPRKLVRKPRGAPPGQVSVAGGKTMRLRMEAERLRRLLASRGDE